MEAEADLGAVLTVGDAEARVVEAEAAGVPAAIPSDAMDEGGRAIFDLTSFLFDDDVEVAEEEEKEDNDAPEGVGEG